VGVRIVVLCARDLNWSFDDRRPSWRTKSAIKDYGRTVNVDPTPCYSHDRDLVRVEAKHVDEAFPIGVPVTVHVSRWEELGRTNGWASQEWNYYAGKKGDQKRWEVAIDLAGKRIPLHPAMTRYLVAHEYGHAVDYWLCHVRGLQPDGLDEEYRKIRGLPKSSGRYGPGRWHANVGELIANDFRVLVAERELEFWPHPGIARPEEERGVRQFWRRALKDAA
jgi:hypothetical protein